MSALRQPMATPLQPRHAPAEVVPSLDLDPGYRHWPRRLGWVEELGYIVSEDGHPWWTVIGGLLFLGLLLAAVGGFVLLAPAPLP